FLQLVEGLTPVRAGWWMGPPALAMFVAAIGAPLIARRVRPGVVMAATLGVSVLGYAVLASAGRGDGPAVVVAFAFVYLGLGAIAALGTDIVVGAAPAAKSGSAAAMSETVQELGIAVGVALLGSVTAAVYRSRMTGPEGVAEGVGGPDAERLAESLPAAVSVADRVPGEAVRLAQDAFAAGVNIAALIGGAAVVVVAVVCATALRHLRPLD